MDGELLRQLYHRLFEDRQLQKNFGCRYSDAAVLLIYFVAALSNHSLYWAHDKRHWPLWLRQVPIPSYSQTRKRLKWPRIQKHLQRLDQQLRGELKGASTDADSSLKICDGKPLVVSGFSKDKDAKRGHVPEGFARGYKVHVLIDARSGVFDAIQVTALNAGESTVMRQMLEPMDLKNLIIRADSNYDSNPLYTTIDEQGGRLIAPRKKPGTGLGKGVEHHPHRLRAIEELEGQDPANLKHHRRQRNRVEQRLAHLTNVPFGLWALPNSVRRLHRVTRWVQVKILLYHFYLTVQRQTLEQAA